MLEGGFSTACYSHDQNLPNVAVNVSFLESFFQDLVCTTSSGYTGKSVTHLMWCKTLSTCYFLPYHTHSSKLCAAAIM